MRPSKSRSRSKSNRSRSVGNNVNRVFESSGPEGKVRGTPQQIIEKYNQLARDAQLGNDRVAAENFQQHAEHYARLLGEAQREQDARREQQESQNQQPRGRDGGGGNDQPQQQPQQPQQQPQQQQPQQQRRKPQDQPAEAEAKPDNSAADVIDFAGDDAGSTLVETPEEKPAEAAAPEKPAEKPAKPRRARKPRAPKAEGDTPPEGESKAQPPAAE